MISMIEGRLVGFTSRGVLLKTEGLCYEVLLTAADRRALSARPEGSTLALHTYHFVEFRPGGGHLIPTLVGFEREQDREFFALLTGVDGIGVHKALEALVLPIPEVARAIEDGDAARLCSLRGVGERLANKIIAALRGKTGAYAARVSRPETSPAEVAIKEEALEILLQLGHKKPEADSMLQRALARYDIPRSAAELVRLAYRAKDHPGLGD